jgi:hypothetical protein
MSKIDYAFASGKMGKLRSMLLALGTALTVAPVFAAPPPNGSTLTFIDCVQVPGPTYTAGVNSEFSLPQPNLSISVYSSNDTPANNTTLFRFSSGSRNLYVNQQGTVRCATSDGCYVQWALTLNNPAGPPAFIGNGGNFGVLRSGTYYVTQDPTDGTRAILGCGT